uniref:Ribosomal protein L5 n=1 Tax=Panagrolaimus davidi TaxID=227884 RepID=A0A914QXI1_9BILA
MPTKALCQTLDQKKEHSFRLIDSGPFKFRTNNIIHVFLEACETKIYDQMTFPCIFYHTILGGIHPKYFAQNLGHLLSITILKSFKKEGAKYCIGVATSEASLKLHLKLPNINIIDKVPYERFFDHGRKPFENVLGENKFAYPFIIDLDKY